MTDFFVTKRFLVPTVKLKQGGKAVDTEKSKIEHFWKQCSEYADKHGCYIFSIKAAKGERPFYVGKASRQSFRNESLSLHKLYVYNLVLGSRRGTPYLSFVVQDKIKGKWSLTAIDEVEEYLIAQAAARNPELSNRRRLPDQQWSIRGVVNGGKGKRSLEATAFRTLMGIKEL